MSMHPSEWLSVKIEDVVEILDALRVPVNNTERLERIEGKNMADLYPYYGATGEVGKIDDYIFDEELVALGEDGVPFLDHLKNKAYLLVEKTWVNNHAHVLKGWPNCFNNKFLLHYLNQFDYHGYVNGGTRLKLTQANMRKMPVPLASIFEQKEIAERLDKLLAQVEATQARLAHIPAIIKQFRQSVLAAAVSGRLTLNAGIEFELLTINAVCNAAFDGPFGSKLKSSDYTDDGVRVIRLENIGHLEFLSDKKTYISKEKHSELKKNEILKNDVLFSSFVDQDVRVCIFDAIDNVYINKADCFCLRPNQNKINSQYLSFLLASRTSYEQIKEKVQGVTRPRINLKILKSLEFRIPSIEAQNKIVRRVEQLFAYADSIEQQAKAAKERVDNLTQAILAKAFRGELTADWRAANPDLISGDNSAEALLEKIKAERQAMKSKKKTAAREKS